ncbi:MAG: hypothetical protein M3Y89_18390 [Actinomycetota bacterium]|nr:hypothetical protein [Actinomycetota bacterium]
MIEVAFALRRQRRTLTVWTVATTFYAALITLAFPSVHHAAKSIQDTLPKDLAQAFGMGDLSTPAGYLGAELFGLILPLLLIAATITGTAALTAGYEDAGYFETLLVLPTFYAALLDIADAQVARDPEWSEVRLTDPRVKLAFQRAEGYIRPQWPAGTPQQAHLVSRSRIWSTRPPGPGRSAPPSWGSRPMRTTAFSRSMPTRTVTRSASAGTGDRIAAARRPR